LRLGRGAGALAVGAWGGHANRRHPLAVAL